MFGLGSFSIDEVTLNSLLKLPIWVTNWCELTSQELAEVQYKIQGVKYFLIDERSRIGQKMFR